MASSTAKCRRKQARAERGRAALRGSLALDSEQQLAEMERRFAEQERRHAQEVAKLEQRIAELTQLLARELELGRPDGNAAANLDIHDTSDRSSLPTRSIG